MLEEDIRRNLHHPNVNFQSKGFSSLLSALQVEVEVKKRRSLCSLLFDCLRAQSPSLAVVGSLRHRGALFEGSIRVDQ